MTVPKTFAFADIWEMAADAVPDRIALVVGSRRSTYAVLEERANRLANHLASLGVGRDDHVGLYLDNCTEYVEAMLACFKLRAVPINVNYRYVAAELAHLLDDSDSVGVVHPPKFAATLDEIRGDVPNVRFTLETGAEYDAALAAAPADRPAVERSGDDRYIIYTGGTTGLPKGVVWRQEDALYACMGGGDPMRTAGPATDPAQLPDRMVHGEFCYLPVAPMIHAAAQWTSFSWFFAGGKVVLMEGSLDGHAVWRAIDDEKVNLITVVGDAVARPLLDAWDEAVAKGEPYSAASLFSFSNGGAPMSPSLRERVADALPHALIIDGFGSSESGAQGSARLTAEEVHTTRGVLKFTPGADTLVIDDDNRPVAPGSGIVGRVVAKGRLPLGYYNDPEKTAATFIQVDGERWVVTGDMATVTADGTIELLGRGSGCINTGGEKVYPEEVEAVLKAHPDVYDVVVVGIPDDRWGSAVTAVVQPVEGAAPTLESLAEHCRRSLARYKVPKAVVIVDHVVRSPAGKADYRWAREAAISAIGG